MSAVLKTTVLAGIALVFVAGQCKLKDAVVENGVLIFENSDIATQYNLDMTTVPDGQTAYVRCNRGYYDSASSNDYVANACSGTSWGATITCKSMFLYATLDGTWIALPLRCTHFRHVGKDKSKYGMKRRDARNICTNKWATSMSQRCGWFDKATQQLTAGPCDALTNKQCPFIKDRTVSTRAIKSYNFCSCLPSKITN